MRFCNICNGFLSRLRAIGNCCNRTKSVGLQKNLNNTVFIRDTNIRSENNIILPQYKTIVRLGSGGNSIVYKAQEISTKNIYTYKRITKSTSALREINVLKKLPNSRFLPKYKDHIIDGNKISIITEYIDGIEAFEWLKHNYSDKRRSLPRSTVYVFLKEILMAVNTLNQINLCHLDIKFENIILQNYSTNNELNYKLVLIDYGMSHKCSNKLEKLDCTCGTVGYTPFEIYQGYYHKNSDVWSIGVCLWIMLTGEMPFLHSKLFYKGKNNYNESAFLFPNEYHKRCKKKFNINDNDFYMVEQMLQISYIARPTVDYLLKKINENEGKSN
jgi:serine/threonine protein kinase